jgi:hypothetical protein
MEPVRWVGRCRFLDGWAKVWSCERHADELPWASDCRIESHGARVDINSGADSGCQEPGPLTLSRFLARADR